MELIRPVLLTGLLTMAAVAIATAIWPSVGYVVLEVFVIVLVTVTLVPAAVLGRRAWAAAERRRARRAFAAVEVPSVGAPVPRRVEPQLAPLGESA